MTAVSDGYNIWTVERKPVSVHLRESVAAQIRTLANAPLDSPPELERGGILWGRVRDTGENYYLIAIEHVDLLECDRGSLEGWLACDKDRRKLKKRLKEPPDELQCVGYWRTHQRPGLYLDTIDLDLMASFFAKPWCVALCVRPPSTAGFFLWENGDIHRTSSYREFELPDAEQSVVVPSRATETRRPLLAGWRSWAAAAAVLTALAITPFAMRTESNSTPFNVLSMQAETQPGLVRLRWNPKSEVIGDSGGGVIWIADGTDEAKLELSSAQLRVGALDYRPSGNQLNFRMQIGEFTESLRVSHPSPAAPTPNAVEAAAVAEPTEQLEEDVAPFRETPRTARRRQIRERVSIPTRVLELPVTPSPAAIPDRAPEIAAPPPQIALAPKLDEQPPITDRIAEVPKVMASVEKPPRSPFHKAFGWIPGIRNKGYVPAKAVRQVQPRVATKQDTSVAVRVSIDPKGFVRDADLMTRGVDGHIGRSAVEAAKRWRFEPARDDDRSVASNMVLRFRFEGNRN